MMFRNFKIIKGRRNIHFTKELYMTEHINIWEKRECDRKENVFFTIFRFSNFPRCKRPCLCQYFFTQTNSCLTGIVCREFNAVFAIPFFSRGEYYDFYTFFFKSCNWVVFVPQMLCRIILKLNFFIKLFLS